MVRTSKYRLRSPSFSPWCWARSSSLRSGRLASCRFERGLDGRTSRHGPNDLNVNKGRALQRGLHRCLNAYGWWTVSTIAVLFDVDGFLQERADLAAQRVRATRLRGHPTLKAGTGRTDVGDRRTRRQTRGVPGAEPRGCQQGAGHRGPGAATAGLIPPQRVAPGRGRRGRARCGAGHSRGTEERTT